jgi:hypothetical protein
MIDKKSNTKPKRLPKGQRIHIRRLKQAANKESINVSTIVRKGS